nr:MAG TPA: hypothetical protein [Bacteriophage sp.]
MKKLLQLPLTRKASTFYNVHDSNGKGVHLYEKR